MGKANALINVINDPFDWEGATDIERHRWAMNQRRAARCFAQMADLQSAAILKVSKVCKLVANVSESASVATGMGAVRDFFLAMATESALIAHIANTDVEENIADLEDVGALLTDIFNKGQCPAETK